MKQMVRENVTNAFTIDPIVASNPSMVKKKRCLPGTPDPEAEVVALSPQTLMATNRFLCEICGRGFQRDQNLQLHRRGHNVPWKLRQRSTKEVKKRVYVCPEKTCVHHQPLRALGDLTGIKKHYCRKHGEKKWKCEKCAKRYAVQSDWKAHLKTCGTKEYKCDCGTIFSRRDSFHTHRAFCVALAEETARVNATSNIHNIVTSGATGYHNLGTSQEPKMFQHFFSLPKPVSIDNVLIPGDALWMGEGSQLSSFSQSNLVQSMSLGTLYGDPFVSYMNTELSNYQVDWGSKLSTISAEELTSASPLVSAPSLYSTQHNPYQASQVSLSATALLQKAAQIGATSTTPSLLLNFGVKSKNIHAQNGNKYSESSGSNTMLITHGTDADCSSENDIPAMNMWQMYPSKRRNIVKDTAKEGETRDFLGVGVEAICASSSINKII